MKQAARSPWKHTADPGVNVESKDNSHREEEVCFPI